MAQACSHASEIVDAPAVDTGCVECLESGGSWLHLRRCDTCGHVGCCDQSPNRHATAHFHETEHPLVQSFEPGEDWYWCYADQVGFEMTDQKNSPSYEET